MNRVFTSIVLALSLITTATAQSTAIGDQPQDPNEIILLSTYTDGNYNVERLLVMESNTNNNEFVVRYKINLSKLISSYDNNSAEIEGLHKFVDELQQDSLHRIKSYSIVGYASPDGPAQLNKKLAEERATDFAAYIEKELDMAQYQESVTGVTYSWADTKNAIESSAVPNKSEVLSLISSNMAQAEIQADIEEMPASWEYIKTNILPRMRSVEMHIKYNSWEVVENRTLIEEEVTAQPTTVIVDMGGRAESRGSDECYDVIDSRNCILVEMPNAKIDFECEGDMDREKFKANSRGEKFKQRGKGERVKAKERTKKRRWWRKRS